MTQPFMQDILKDAGKCGDCNHGRQIVFSGIVGGWHDALL
jgi:hypothetical protein